MTTFNRREFINLSSLAAAAAALAACTPLNSPTDSATPSLLPNTITRDQDWLTRRTLHRITYGPTQADVEYATQIGIDNFIDEQLAPGEINDPVVDKLLKNFSTLNAAPRELVDIEPPGLPARELTVSTLLRAIFSQRQLNEMMVDFWSNHFNIPLAGGFLNLTKPTDDREVIRPHALGSFASMLHASAKSPAMLIYLNNAESTKDRPNENYSRELLELHTLGVDGGYTHHDIDDLARALTGWTVARRSSLKAGQFTFNRRNHDTGEKQILDRSFPGGGGIQEGEEVLDMLIEHPATAKHLAAKLVRRFVSDDPPASLVTRAAETFSQTRGDIPKVMSTILHSAEFKASLGSKLKRPIEVFASTLRLTQAEIPPNKALFDFLVTMGQPPFRWPSPDGYPDYAAAWTNTSGTLARWNFALTVAFASEPSLMVDWGRLSQGTESSQEIIEALSLSLLGDLLPPDAHQVVLDFANHLDPELARPGIGALILSSPYFQYR